MFMEEEEDPICAAYTSVLGASSHTHYPTLSFHTAAATEGLGVRAHACAAHSVPWITLVKLVYLMHPSLYFATSFAVELEGVLDLNL